MNDANVIECATKKNNCKLCPVPKVLCLLKSKFFIDQTQEDISSYGSGGILERNQQNLKKKSTQLLRSSQVLSRVPPPPEQSLAI